MNNTSELRLKIVIGLFVVMAMVLGWRMFQKQIVQHANYKASAEDQYSIKKELPAARGNIYASDMFPLSTNRQFFQVLVVPNNIKNPDEVAEKLAVPLVLNKEEIFALINNNKPYIPPLKHGLTEEESKKISDLKIPGVYVLPEWKRFYPENELASQIVGFVNNLSEGQYGIEGYYNEELKGYGGQILAEKDNLGRAFNIDEKIEPQDGTDIILTLDHNIQYEAENVLEEAIKKYKADSGTITIMDPKTGAVLAIASYPDYDPNKFNEIPKDAQNVFNNAALAPWEPGSVFKPLIMAAAVNEGKVQPDTKNIFSNYVTVDSYEIHTSTDEAYGEETMTQVLENSDNVAMVWISDLLGKEIEYRYIKDLGFGRKSGIEMDTEDSGKVLDVKQWSNALRATAAFGQGISVTPIQLTTAVSAIANGGKLMKPYIVSELQYSNGRKDAHSPQEVKRVFNTDVAQKVKEMMVSVIVNGHGKKAAVDGYKVAGKTGTAQVPKPGGGYYTDRHIGSFIGFAPADDPKFVMLVKLDQPKNVDWAESSAAPTFGIMAKWLLEYFHIPPTQ